MGLELGAAESVTSFLIMFGILEYPPFGYGYGYEPMIARRFYRSRSPFDNYVSAVQRQLERILYDGLLDLCDDLGKEGAEEAATEGKKEQQEQQAPQEEQQEKEAAKQFSFSSISQSRRGRAMGELVEEHRERVVRGDGSVHTVTRRQIGDRWYVHESHSTKDGESSSKETWHNVPEDAIESFKSEWEEKKLLTDQRETEKPAIKEDAKPEKESE